MKAKTIKDINKAITRIQEINLIIQEPYKLIITLNSKRIDQKSDEIIINEGIKALHKEKEELLNYLKENEIYEKIEE